MSVYTIMIWSLLYLHLLLDHIINEITWASWYVNLVPIIILHTNSHLYKPYRLASKDDLTIVCTLACHSFWPHLFSYIIIPILYSRQFSNHYLSSDLHQSLWIGKTVHTHSIIDDFSRMYLIIHWLAFKFSRVLPRLFSNDFIH